MLRLLAIFLLSLMLVVMAGCEEAPPEEEPEEAEEAEELEEFSSVIDGEGEEVVLEEEPENIVSLAPSKTEKIFALGWGDQIAGVSDFCNYPPEVEEKDLERVGDAFEVSEEAIFALDADLVVTNTLPEGMREMLEGEGVPVFFTNPENIEQTLESIELMGELLQAQDEAGTIIEEMEDELEAYQAKLEDIEGEEKPEVLLLLDDQLYVAGQGTMQSEILEYAGGVNVVEEVVYDPLTEEAIIEKNPEVIFITFPEVEEVTEREAWEEIEAVQNDRVYLLEAEYNDAISRSTPRLTEGIDYLHDLLY